MTVRTVAMLTAGGLAPCLSSAVGGLIERYTAVAPDVRLIAYTSGYAGLLKGEYVEVTPEVREQAHLLVPGRGQFRRWPGRRVDARPISGPGDRMRLRVRRGFSGMHAWLPRPDWPCGAPGSAWVRIEMPRRLGGDCARGLQGPGLDSAPLTARAAACTIGITRS